MDGNNVVYKKIKNERIVYEKLLTPNETWKNKSRSYGSHTHKICSYVAMFPATMAKYFIEKYSNEEDNVLDPFSGRGTTLLEARLLNRNGYAVDLNPLAYVLSHAKSKDINWKKIEDLVDVLEVKYADFEFDAEKYASLEYIKTYYSLYTIKQLCFIRDFMGINFEKNTFEKNLLLSICLGIMHGPMKKDGTSSYLSLDTSNSISFAAEYVKKYAKSHNLVKPEFDVFNQLRKKIIFLKNKNIIENKKKSHVIFGNALNLNKLISKTKFDLIFSSPPYMNIINYARQNWIKLWLLGYEYEKLNQDIKLDDKHSYKLYIEFIDNFLIVATKVLNKKAKLILVVGNIKQYCFLNIWYEIKHKHQDLKLVEIYEDDIEQNKKTTNHLGTKAGKATKKELIYVFELV